eukprot:8240719-Pyramimonas_sp.AAC.1
MHAVEVRPEHLPAEVDDAALPGRGAPCFGEVFCRSVVLPCRIALGGVRVGALHDWAPSGRVWCPPPIALSPPLRRCP